MRSLFILSLLATLTIAVPAAAEEPACWSATASPSWPQLNVAIQSLHLCEKLPKTAPNHSAGIETRKLDVCSAPEGARINASVAVHCKTGDSAIIRMSATLDADIDLSLDLGRCKLTNLKADLRGPLAGALGGSDVISTLVRTWLQAQMDHFCGKP